jgi:hypothetical protein
MTTLFDRILLLRLSSAGSGGRTTRRPSTGNALSSMLKPVPSLCGKAAPIFVRRFCVLPPRSYSSTVKTRAADDGRSMLGTAEGEKAP